MEALQRPAAVAKVRSEPIQKLRMSGLGAHAPEVVRAVNDSASEVVMPDPIDDRPPSERIGWIREPFG